MKRWIFIGLTVVLALIFLISGFFLVRYWAQSHKEQAQFDQLLQLTGQPTAPQSPSDPTAEDYDPYVEISHPVTGERIRVLREYAQLFQQNPHMVGWMHISGTKVNYPVMQTPQEPNYYLNRNFNRESSNHGCLYAQENCDLNTSDNVIIYGHNMKDGSMFAALHKYKKGSFWQEHKTILFNTLYEHRTYEIFAVFYTVATDGIGFDYHLFTEAEDENAFADFVKTCKSLSVYDTGVEVTYGDQIITLSTCEYSQTNGRLVVVAKCSDNP